MSRHVTLVSNFSIINYFTADLLQFINDAVKAAVTGSATTVNNQIRNIMYME